MSKRTCVLDSRAADRTNCYYSIFRQFFKFIPRYRFGQKAEETSGNRCCKHFPHVGSFLTCLYARLAAGGQCHRPGGKTRPQAVIRHKNPFPEQPRTRHRGIDPRRNGARGNVHRKTHLAAHPGRLERTAAALRLPRTVTPPQTACFFQGADGGHL